MDKQGVIPPFMPVPSRSIILTSVAFNLLHTLYISKSPHGCHCIYHILGNTASPVPTLALESSSAPPPPCSRSQLACLHKADFPSSRSPEALVWVSYRRCLSCGWAGFCNSFLHNPYLRPVDFNGAIHASGGCKFGPLGCKVSGA